MLEHNENFELEKEYEQIWDNIRYKKIDEIYELTLDVINLLDKHIDEKLLFHSDYERIQNLFKNMKQKNFFYMSGSAKEIIKSVNPKFENVFEYKECVRDLEYLGNGLADDELQIGKIYRSIQFNGATYKLIVDEKIKTIGSNYFKRVN